MNKIEKSATPTNSTKQSCTSQLISLAMSDRLWETINVPFLPIRHTFLLERHRECWKKYTRSFYLVWVAKKAPHAYRQGLNKEKKGIRSIWECAENTSQSRWWKQTEKYLTEVMHIKNNGFSIEKR